MNDYARLKCKRSEVHDSQVDSDWEVHHINGKKNDNAPSNLIALPRKCHRALHITMKRYGWIYDREQIEAFKVSWLNKEESIKKAIDKKRKRLKRQMAKSSRYQNAMLKKYNARN